jgi:hypothetical protein
VIDSNSGTSAWIADDDEVERSFRSHLGQQLPLSETTSVQLPLPPRPVQSNAVKSGWRMLGRK